MRATFDHSVLGPDAPSPGTAIPRARGQTRSSTGPFKPVNLISNSIFGYCCGSFILSITKKRADSDEVARVYRFEVARGFRDDVAHLSALISPGGEAFWPVGSLASVKPHGQSGIAA